MRKLGTGRFRKAAQPSLGAHAECAHPATIGVRPATLFDGTFSRQTTECTKHQQQALMLGFKHLKRFSGTGQVEALYHDSLFLRLCQSGAGETVTISFHLYSFKLFEVGVEATRLRSLTTRSESSTVTPTRSRVRRSRCALHSACKHTHLVSAQSQAPSQLQLRSGRRSADQFAAWICMSLVLQSHAVAGTARCSAALTCGQLLEPCRPPGTSGHGNDAATVR